MIVFHDTEIVPPSFLFKNGNNVTRLVNLNALVISLMLITNGIIKIC